MRYWDSSALVPLLVEETTSARLRRTVREDPAVVTWWATRVECAGALARLARDADLTPAAMTAAMTRLRAASAVWTEVTPSSDVREQAIRLVRVHALRSADALQLAAAIVAAEFQPRALDFITLDTRLAEAADAEGFRVTPRVT
jgi:predicted nucleic acid-binding protein